MKNLHSHSRRSILCCMGKQLDNAKFSVGLKTAGLVSASCLIGVAASLSGGIFPGIVAVVFVGAIALAWPFVAHLFRKQAEPEIVPATPVPAASEIPPDRIDTLTGLANENGLMAWFAEKGTRIAADGKGIIVLSADLAEFDQIERSRGKQIAEAVLIEVAGRVKTCTGSDGIAARTSGDEFAAIASVVPNNSAEVAEEHAGKLADLIQRPVELPSGVVWISGSVGAAFGAVSEGTAVLANAREALVKAKRLGRGHYVVHKPEQQ